MIKTENDKVYHFPSHSIGKAQILSDTKLPPSQLFDMRNADGQIVHINIEDISQFFTYHEVFGKIPTTGDHAFPTPSNALTIPTMNPPSSLSNVQSSNASSINQSNAQTSSTPLVIPKIENLAGNQNNNSNNNQTNTTSGTSSTSTSISSNGKIVGLTPTCVTNSISADQAAMPSPALHTCDICGKVFPFKYQFIVHRRYHNERKPFICQVCGQAFTTSVDLTSHGKIHDGVKMFTCNICYNVFANDASLERHMKRHSTDKPFGCTICQKTFQVRALLLFKGKYCNLLLFNENEHFSERSIWTTILGPILVKRRFGKF